MCDLIVLVRLSESLFSVFEHWYDPSLAIVMKAVVILELSSAPNKFFAFRTISPQNGYIFSGVHTGPHSHVNREYFFKKRLRDTNPGISLEFGMLKLTMARTKCSQIPEMRYMWRMLLRRWHA